MATTLPADYSPAPAGHGGLPTPHSRFGLFLPAALLPNRLLLRRLRDATEHLFVTNTQLPTSTVAPQVEEAAAVEVQIRSAGTSGIWTPVSAAGRMNAVVLFLTVVKISALPWVYWSVLTPPLLTEPADANLHQQRAGSPQCCTAGEAYPAGCGR